MTWPVSETIVVLAAIIERDGRYLLARRLKNTHLAGLWEFPGGKCEPGETHEVCLEREILEELGASVVVGDEILVVEHAYPGRRVRLHFRRCELLGEPRAILAQELRWAPKAELRQLEFPAADAELIEILSA